MRVHAVPATITVAPDAQLADVVFADDRVDGDLVLQRPYAAALIPLDAEALRHGSGPRQARAGRPGRASRRPGTAGPAADGRGRGQQDREPSRVDPQVPGPSGRPDRAERIPDPNPEDQACL